MPLIIVVLVVSVGGAAFSEPLQHRSFMNGEEQDGYWHVARTSRGDWGVDIAIEGEVNVRFITKISYYFSGEAEHRSNGELVRAEAYSDAFGMNHYVEVLRDGDEYRVRSRRPTRGAVSTATTFP